MTRPDGYIGRYRRMLLDMHIPDWDDRFLASHDPKELVRCYGLAGVDAVMLYCKSHVGLCYWPTSVGRKHPGVEGDAVRATVRLLHERDILVCAYTSVAYDREAVVRDPDLSVVPAHDPKGRTAMWPRWSVVCLNKRRYLDEEKALYTELLQAYPFDAFFLDMAFWPCVCVCDDCRRRYRDEESADIPKVVDWESVEWARYQAARERWADEFMQELISHARSLVDVPVYHNFACSFIGWMGGTPLRAYRSDSFLGADLTGGRDEQLFATKLMRATSANLPGEYMTPRAPNMQDHISVKTEGEMTLQALGALATGSAVLFIDAIDPDGKLEPDVYEQVGRVNARYASFEPLIGGEHVADVGVYFSSDAFVDLSQNGTPLEKAGASGRSVHLESAVGATRVLQREHIASGVVTYRQLTDLTRYPVLIVPDLVRITEDEAEAFRDYVFAGGSLYASGRTALLSTDGTRHDDFLLADTFGVHYEMDEPGAQIFVRPVNDDLMNAIHPQRFVGWSAGPMPPRISAAPRAQTLATLSLPYAYPAPGTHLDTDWASTYSMPPWSHTDVPVVVEHEFGDGRAIYSSFPLERDTLPAGRALFGSLVRRLLGDRATVSADAHPAVWVEAFHQADERRFVVNLVNFAEDHAPIPTEVVVRLRLPDSTVVERKTMLEVFEPIVVEYR
jgi:hypothetical protein